MQQPVAQLAPTAATSSTLKKNEWNLERDLKDGTGRTASAIDRLYNRFDGIYMSKWKSNFPGIEAIENWKDAWSQGLTRNAITIQIALDGVQKCERNFMWPPSLPEFLALCKPPMDYEQAFMDAVRQMHKRHGDGEDYWPAPALYWAAVDFGQYELRNASYSQAAAKWKRVLDKRLQGECEAVPVFALQLAAPARNSEGVTVTSADAKAEALRAMANLSLKKPSREAAIERAEAVLAKQSAGQYVQPFQLTHAREVLDRLAADPSNDEEPIT